MNARDIILQDCINLNKGEESIIYKRSRMAAFDSFLHKMRIATLVLVPTSLFYAITKRHTGRTFYRNLFIFSLGLEFLVCSALCHSRDLLLKELNCKEDELREHKQFYINALLER